MAKLTDLATLIKELTYDDMMKLARHFSYLTTFDNEGKVRDTDDEAIISEERYAADFSDWAEQTLSEEESSDGN